MLFIALLDLFKTLQVAFKHFYVFIRLLQINRRFFKTLQYSFITIQDFHTYNSLSLFETCLRLYRPLLAYTFPPKFLQGSRNTRPDFIKISCKNHQTGLSLNKTLYQTRLRYFKTLPDLCTVVSVFISLYFSIYDSVRFT